jgi:hypothetical protein
MRGDNINPEKCPDYTMYKDFISNVFFNYARVYKNYSRNRAIAGLKIDVSNFLKINAMGKYDISWENITLIEDAINNTFFKGL